MSLLDHTLRSTHDLTAILIVSVPEITPYLDEILRRLTTDTDVDIHANAIGMLLATNYDPTNLTRLTTAGLLNILSEVYRVTHVVTADTNDVVQELLHLIVTALTHKLDILGISKEYLFMHTTPITIVTNHKVCLVNKVSLNNAKTIELRYYDPKYDVS